MQPTSPLPSPQFRMEIDFASNLVAEATLWECDFLSHHNSRYRYLKKDLQPEIFFTDCGEGRTGKRLDDTDDRRLLDTCPCLGIR